MVQSKWISRLFPLRNGVWQCPDSANTMREDSCGQERSRETVYSSGQCVKKQCGRISSCPRTHLARENAQNYMDSTAAARKRNGAEKPVISMVCRLMREYKR